ncbi:MAG: hypothetical protein QOE83_898 [Actinomycetota bacterium]|jgi:hypothetical protein|nr:hypothetical protein [Actinomycetota bacterium]
MRTRLVSLVVGAALMAIAVGASPASATIPPELPFGPSYFGPGPLTCGSTTYIVTERGFGADLQVVGSTTVLIFHAYGPTPPSNPAPGLKLVHCTGEIPDSLGNIDHFDLFVSIVPGR